MKVGINGMGRIGRLALRAAFGAAATAHLLAFDSVQGKWREQIEAVGESSIKIGSKSLSFSSHAAPADIPWGELGVDLVLECTGKFLTPETIQGHLDRGCHLQGCRSRRPGWRHVLRSSLA